MDNLKDKLAHRVKAIETNNSQVNTSNVVPKTSENVIMLNTQKNSKSPSVIPEFAISMNEAKERIKMLQTFVNEMMIPDVDYGIIPKCSKPSLFKSGAEKLCDIFGFSKYIEVLNRVENWEKGIFHYEVKAILVNKKTGLTEAEGIGCCNNKESKYRNQDSFSIVNTILKMAKKRALIDAVLSATRSSGIFTQDVEDYTGSNEHPFTKPPEHSMPKYKNPNNKSDNRFITPSNNTSARQPINKSQYFQIISIITEIKIPPEEVKRLLQEKYKVQQTKYLSFEQANDFISFLKLCNTV